MPQSEFDGSHPDEFSLGTINNKIFHQTQLVYYRVTTCFDPVGSSSGLHCEPVNYKAAYIVGIPSIIWDPNNVCRFMVNWFIVKA